MSFADLPEDNQRQILSSIPCPVDRGRMSLVCRSWRRVIRRHRGELEGRLLQPPPLLRAPHPLGLGLRSARAACVLSGGRVHHFLDVAPPHARFFGSHDGAWLLLDPSHPRDADAAAARAVNVRTGAVRDLPREVHSPTDQRLHRMVIHAAVLSLSPEDARCVGAAIVTSWRDRATLSPRRRGIALWFRDCPAMATFPLMPRTSSTSVKADNLLEVVQWQTRRFCPRVRLDVRARYLVVSGGELLMVVRFMPHPDHQPTSKFKVFRMIKRNNADADANDFPVDRYPLAWSELDTLGGRMLFVGHGCSRSFKVDEYPGFEAGIYFLDGGMFYDDAVIFATGDATRYPCCDNGNWTQDGRVQRCFPRSDPSDHSAPVWLLP
ncbi:unnamed protein product [Urochloa decumbens]|uniref:F-box domain-containing protein n=1 Tax=Urochloa decumbens TaxID=240449 RepID=A0ABC9B6Z7_9POAL